mgnify:CR=1 FL=1
MKTFKQFMEEGLPSNYTDYKAPAVQAAHARSMASASRLRQGGMNATAENPEDQAKENMSGSDTAKPLPGTTIRSGLGKGAKVGDPGINIAPKIKEQWYANPTSRSENPDGSTTTTFTTPDGQTQKVQQTKKEKEEAGKINQQYNQKYQTKTNSDSIW